MKFTRALSVAVFALVSACAAGGAPEPSTTGTPSPFDGDWHGTAASSDQGCDSIYVDGAVTNGQFIGNVRQAGRKVGEIWGQLNASGAIEGVLRSSGVSVGSSTLQFTGDKAEGSWTNMRCSGAISLMKS